MSTRVNKGLLPWLVGLWLMGLGALELEAPSAQASNVRGHARGYLTTPEELAVIRHKADQGLEPYAMAVADALDKAQRIYSDPLWQAPRVIDIQDREVESPEFLYRGSRSAYALAVAYHLLKDADPALADQYAQSAYGLVMGMPQSNTQVSGYQANTRLNLSLYIPTFVYAADLLADWTVPGTDTPFYRSSDHQQLKEWLGREIVRYPYNIAHTSVSNWGAWGRAATAVLADYVGDDAPLFVQQFRLAASGEYVIDPSYRCQAKEVSGCVQIDGATAYAAALRLHFDYVDGRMYEFTLRSCDANRSKSMLRPDGGLPDELRRQYGCDTTTVPDSYGAAARYSQHATDAMVVLAELAWRRGCAEVYTHIDPVTQRGAIYRSLQFMLKNRMHIGRASMFEIANRFYTYRAGNEPDRAKRAEFQFLLQADLPGILKRQGNWPAGLSWVSFGTLTHGFAAGETLRPPPTVPPRINVYCPRYRTDVIRTAPTQPQLVRKNVTQERRTAIGRMMSFHSRAAD
jgi:hypothetical protein